MSCPFCNKYSVCGCKHCHKRKGLSSVRTQKMKGEHIKCPYCRKTTTIEHYESFNYSREINKNNEITTLSENMKNSTNAVEWYKSLDLNRRFALKELAVVICGLRWEDFNILFSPRERLTIIYDKLKLEGFDI